MTKFYDRNHENVYEITAEADCGLRAITVLLNNKVDIHYFNADDDEHNKLSYSDEVSLMRALNSLNLTDKYRVINEIIKHTEENNAANYDYTQGVHFIMQFPDTNDRFMIDTFNQTGDAQNSHVIQLDKLATLLEQLPHDPDQIPDFVYATRKSTYNNTHYTYLAVWGSISSIGQFASHKRELESDYFGENAADICLNLVHGSILTIKQVKQNKRKTSKTYYQLFRDNHLLKYDQHFDISQFLTDDCALFMEPLVQKLN